MSQTSPSATTGDARILTPSITQPEFPSSLSTPRKGRRFLKVLETSSSRKQISNTHQGQTRCSFARRKKSPQRGVFSEVFAAKGLHAACLRSRTVKQRVLAVAGRWCPKWVKKGGGEEYYGEGDSRTISPYTNSSFFQLLFLAYSSVCSLGVFEDLLIQNTNKKRISNNLHVQNYSISKSNIGTWFCLAS